MTVAYSNRSAYKPTKLKTRRSIQTGVRIPVDLIAPMDAFCRERKIKRAALVVAALRAHLKTPDPASVAKQEK